MQGKIDCFGITDVGCKRPTNQDQFLIADLNKALRLQQSSLTIDDYETLFGRSQGQLFLVADGMGGHAAGERASQIAVETVTTYMLNTMPWFFRLDRDRDDDFRDELKESLARCQQQIAAHAEAQPEHSGMGTTLTMAYLIWPRMYVVHAGDSRCYVHRDGELKRMTKDHTVAQQFVEQGVFEADAIGDRWHNTLWNVLGGDSEEIAPEVEKVQLRRGDTVLLCTDGLNKHVSYEAISELLSQDLPARDLCERLLEAAKQDGGSDNITAVVVRFLDMQQSIEQAEQTAEAQLDAKPDPFADTELEITEPAEAGPSAAPVKDSDASR